MKRLPALAYHRPATVEEAIALLGSAGGDARLLAGGTDVIVDLKSGRVAASSVVSLRDVPGMEGIEVCGAGLRIGARTRVTEVTGSSLVRERVPALADAAAVLATPQVRALATVGGNLGRASPASDLGPPLLVHGAVLDVVGPDGRRSIPIDEWYLGPGLTTLGRGELIRSVEVPAAGGAGSAHLKIGTRSGGTDIAVAGASAAVARAPDGTVAWTRIALASVAPTPMRALAAERVVTAGVPGAGLFSSAGDAAAAECRPIDDQRASAAYRRRIVPVLVRRALTAAWERAGEAA